MLRLTSQYSPEPHKVVQKEQLLVSNIRCFKVESQLVEAQIPTAENLYDLL